MIPGTFDEAPAEEASPPPKRPSVVLWLVVFGLGIVVLALYLTSSVIDTENQQLQSDVDALFSGLTVTPRPNETEDAIQAQLGLLRSQIREIETLYPTLVQGHINWPSVLSALGSYDPRQITLSSLNQTEMRLSISGKAGDEAMVLAYSKALEDSGFFDRVVVQSMRVITPPTATPTPTPSPTRPSDATLGVAPPPAGPVFLPMEPAKYVEFILLVELKVQEP